MIRATNIRVLAVAALALTALAALAAPAMARSGSAELFIRSAVEHADGTATFPLQRGSSGGHTVWYVVLDSSSGAQADARGVNRAQKLANAGAAVQDVRVVDGVVEFPATVDFSPVRRVIPGPAGFPPLVAEPGARAEAGYSPLIRLPDGTILNAPHVANDTGRADKVTVLDTVTRTVRYRETNGFSRGDAVRYVSTDASDEAVAALEDSTYAPAFAAAPFAGGDGTDSARAGLVAFVNGQTGAGNPQRQGLNSALLDGLDPLNVLAWKPNQGRYSPLWDVHPAQWSGAAVTSGLNLRQRDFAEIAGDLTRRGLVTGPDGTPLRSAGFVVDCPIVSSR